MILADVFETIDTAVGTVLLPLVAAAVAVFVIATGGGDS